MFAVAGLMSPKRRVTRSTQAGAARVKSMRYGIC